LAGLDAYRVSGGGTRPSTGTLTAGETAEADALGTRYCEAEEL
jgi:hypothetical protein